MNVKWRPGTAGEYLTNLQAPPPWPRKALVILRNFSRRFILRQACCGHNGEPGC
jgi:hypothetical protein